MRFTIRDLLWLTLLAAVLVAWWVDHQYMAREIDGFYLETVHAIVIQVDEAQQLIHVAAGSDDGVSLGHTMDVSRGNQYLGRLVVQQVDPDASIARIKQKWRVIRKGDCVSYKFDRRHVRPSLDLQFDPGGFTSDKPYLK